MTIVDATSAPPGAVLVRVRAGDADWIRTLPVVPGNATLTASVSHPRLAHVPADELVARGYRLIGVAASFGADAHVELLVPHRLQVCEPDWFAALLQRAERAFDLRHGPVQQVFAGTIEAHVRALPRRDLTA
jgi:hypothetical protein